MDKREKIIKIWTLLEDQMTPEIAQSEEAAKEAYSECCKNHKGDVPETFEDFFARWKEVNDKYIEIEIRARLDAFTDEQLDAFITFVQTGAYRVEQSFYREYVRINNAHSDEMYGIYDFGHQDCGCGGSCGKGQ